LSLFALIFSGCGAGTGTPNGPGGDPNATAATVNGKAITMEEVDRAVKQQTQGQDSSKASPLELANVRLQVLNTLVQQEVMFQKAEKEGVVPSDDEITTELNRQKVESRMSVEEFNKQMTQAGLDEKSVRDNLKKSLAIKKLVDKVTGKVEQPNDKEIEDFYKGNPEVFVKKRGVRLAAIVVDPANSGQGDTTTNEAEAGVKVKEVLAKLQMAGSDFAALAREYSEDPQSKGRGGDLGNITEDELKQSYPQLATGFMNPEFTVGRITNVVPLEGKYYIFKLQERIDKDENLTLESPDVRPQINEMLVNSRKQLLAASYQAIAMNEARVDNLLAKRIVDFPNELSGARPASTGTPVPAATAPAATTPANVTTAPVNGNVKANKPVPAANANKPK
jgi:parvulin-like peptidyl-prolyl isomerase